MVEGLLVFLQIEREEGELINDGSKTGRSSARQSRKQYEETAVLVRDMIQALDE